MTALLRCSQPFFGATGLPTVMCLRIFSMCFGPIPLIARNSSTLLELTATYAFSGSYPRLTGQFRELAATPVRLPYSDSPAAAAVFVSGPNRRDKKNRQRGDSCGASNGTAHAHGRMMTQDGGI